MKVFISWSGEESHAMASALTEWLPQVIQSIKPFFSSEGVRKGVSWSQEIGTQLEATNFGILCLTPENLTAEWILFEAGALSKKAKDAHVVPLIAARMAPTDLTPPLSIFQATTIAKADMWRLVKTINAALGAGTLDESLLSRSFERWWPDLEAKFDEAAAQGAAGKPAVSRRPPEDMIEETLELVRSIAQRQQRTSAAEELRMALGGIDDNWMYGGDPVHLTGEALANEQKASAAAHAINARFRRQQVAPFADPSAPPPTNEIDWESKE